MRLMIMIMKMRMVTISVLLRFVSFRFVWTDCISVCPALGEPRCSHYVAFFTSLSLSLFLFILMFFIFTRPASTHSPTQTLVLAHEQCQAAYRAVPAPPYA